MYTKTPMFSNLMAQPSRTLSARGLITYPDTSTDSLTSAEIVSLVVHENAGEHLPLGGVSASTLTLKLDNRQGEWNAKDFDGAIISLEIGIYHPDYSATPLTVDGDAPDTEYEEFADGGAPDTVYTDTIDGGAPDSFPAETYWANIGTFVTESAIGQEQSTTIEIKGADYLGNYAQKEFTDGQTYPRTVLQILQYACSQAGITLDTTTFVNSTQSIATKPVWEPGTTCRDIIGYVACLAAGFARISRDGLLEIVAFDDTPDYTITTARYKNFERQGAIFGPFNALSVYEHGAPNGYGATRIADDIDMVDNELNSIAVQGNPLLAYELCDTLMANMLSGLSGLTFTGAKIDWQGDPSLTNGDAVTLTDLDSVAVVVLIMNQTLTLDSGFSMSSGNSLKSVIKGKAKTEYMRVFTPTGKLNAAALDGDINIRAGRQLNLLAGSNLVVASGGLLNLSATNQIVFTGGSTLADLLGASGNVTYTGSTAPASPNTGDLWFDTGNYNVCKRWSGSAWTEYTQGKLSNSKMTLDATGIALLAAGTFTVASGNFMIDASGNVAMKGSVTSTSGVIGGFTIGATSLSASPSGKPVMTLDTANSKFELGSLLIDYGWDVDSVLHPRLYAPLATLIEIPDVIFSTGSGTATVGIGTAGLSIYDGAAYIESTVEADDYLYHTPAFTGEATSLISKIKGDGKGNIDHSTMPIFARRNVKSIKKDKDGKSILSVADGASLVAMISILTKAVQELNERLEKIENRTK